jgi:hypothetical protein
MKNLLLLILVFAFAPCIHAQVVERNIDPQVLYQHKIQSYTKMKKTGTLLQFAGIVTTAFGLGAMYSAVNEEHTYGYDYTSDPLYNIGIYGTGFGIDMIIGGSILKIIGKRKVIQYKKKLDGLSAGLCYNRNSTGFALVYKF